MRVAPVLRALQIYFCLLIDKHTELDGLTAYRLSTAFPLSCSPWFHVQLF